MKLVSVIIPFYNEWHLTHKRLFELYEHIPFDVEVILVDDCSSENYYNQIKWWTTVKKHNIKYVKNIENLGFGGSMNAGCQFATGDVFILLSNDVQINGDFITPILDKIDECNACLVGGQLLNYNTGWNLLLINEKPRLFPYLAGWLLACTKEVWKDLGGFDLRYSPYDYEDVDLSSVALLGGYKLVELNRPNLLTHFSGITIRKYNPKREEITKRNRAKFVSKWSEILKHDDENESSGLFPNFN